MRVSVSTGCRLHLGFTNLSEDVGRSYGSIGVAVDQPTTTVVLEEQKSMDVMARRPERVHALVRRFCDHYHMEPRVSIKVYESIPEHVGLGSGTQLALAIGLGLAKIGAVDASVRDVATVMGRGKRSGVGTAAFEVGGLVIDAGYKNDPAGRGVPPTVVWRHDVPPDWRFVVAVPAAIRGLSGESEEEAFEGLPPSLGTSEQICRLTQLRLMPALVEHDLAEYGAALTAIDQKTGSYFSSKQGGVYNGKQASGAIDVMLRAGAHGAGQSSWGPAVYGVAHESEAGEVAAKVRAFLQEKGMAGRVFVGRGRNHGTRVEVLEAVPLIASRGSKAAVPWPRHTASRVPPSPRPGGCP